MFEFKNLIEKIKNFIKEDRESDPFNNISNISNISEEEIEKLWEGNPITVITREPRDWSKSHNGGDYQNTTVWWIETDVSGKLTLNWRWRTTSDWDICTCSRSYQSCWDCCESRWGCEASFYEQQQGVTLESLLKG